MISLIAAKASRCEPASFAWRTFVSRAENVRFPRPFQPLCAPIGGPSRARAKHAASRSLSGRGLSDDAITTEKARRCYTSRSRREVI